MTSSEFCLSWCVLISFVEIPGLAISFFKAVWTSHCTEFCSSRFLVLMFLRVACMWWVTLFLVLSSFCFCTCFLKIYYTVAWVFLNSFMLDFISLPWTCRSMFVIKFGEFSPIVQPIFFLTCFMVYHKSSSIFVLYLFFKIHNFN
jgi:hypothetical protein